MGVSPLISLGALVLGAIIGILLGDGTNKRRRKRELKEYVKDIDLTEEQDAAVKRALRRM